MRDPQYLTPENYREGMIIERPEIAPSMPVRFEVAEPGTTLHQMAMVAKDFHENWLYRDGVQRSYVAREGMSVDDAVAAARLLRGDRTGYGIRERRLHQRNVAEARAAVASAERADKDATSAVASAQQAHAEACAERDKLDSRARKVEADEEKIRQELAAASASEDQIVGGGDLQAVEAWSNRVGDLERRLVAATKIAANFRGQADAALSKSQELAGELGVAKLAATRARASLINERLEAGAADIASKISKQLAPLVAELDRLLVELCTVGEDPGDALFGLDRVAAKLRGALEG